MGGFGGMGCGSASEPLALASSPGPPSEEASFSRGAGGEEEISAALGSVVMILG